MGGNDRGEREREWPVCPHCRQPAGDQYETGKDDVREFECNNSNCRCQVFRVPYNTDR